MAEGHERQARRIPDVSINPMSFGQMSPAAQWSLAKLNGSRGGRVSARRRKRKTKTAAVKSRKRSNTRRGKARLVKGSPAAKRYMASIRRKRRK
jgi:hypothetical protein